MRESEFFQLQDESFYVPFSKRTFQRDMKEIQNLFGIEINYSRSLKAYFLEETETDTSSFNRMLEAFNLFNSLNYAKEFDSKVVLESRRTMGTEHLFGLIHAIKSKVQIGFQYEKYGDNSKSKRKVNPLALKEDQHRWYLIAIDLKDDRIKTFALDRITDLEISKTKFKFPKDFDAKKMFQFSYGIIEPKDEEPSDIILSFDPFQGNYIKSLPLHHTQEIIADNKNELRIKLRLFTTDDFIMKLLSYGCDLEVISPASLKREIKSQLKKALALYK